MKNRSTWLGFALGLGLSLVSTSVVSANDDARYKIVMSKNQRLCTQVRDVLNEDLAQYGPGYDPRKFGAPIFSAITWTPLDESFDYAGSVAHVDINNDGTEDVVVRQETSMGRDILVQHLFIFKDEEYPTSATKRAELRNNPFVEIDVGKGYEFRALPQKTFEEPGVLKGIKYYEGVSPYMFIHPLRFQSKTYLLLTQSPDSPAVPNWALVAKYKQGKVREADPAMMDDLCYLKLK